MAPILSMLGSKRKAVSCLTALIMSKVGCQLTGAGVSKLWKRHSRKVLTNGSLHGPIWLILRLSGSGKSRFNLGEIR